ncbi:sugar transferase [Trichormus sp. NMC-1]|uniref:sugar transferase n=1 Tax=Trichormus sp. NMC-1 TaxID=1853259 RepID=UPI0008DC2343|nr:sugar transferase [Trichormus sp. NMC-1]
MSLSTLRNKTKSYTVANLSILNHLTVIDVSSQSLHPSTTSTTKRLIDILGAIVGLIITSLVALPIAIATLCSDPGPILYSQIRCGLNGQTFQIWKFRSMVVNADKLKSLVKNQAQGHIFKSTDDPRITPLGKFLRRSSLDELPQFWNVLMGDMSIVGTRPPTPDEVIHYEPHHWDRLRVKPGITGEWQTHGRSQIKDFESIVSMDLDYQSKWSITYDLMLMFKTIWVVLNRNGAY